jgi:hypothetical protein
MEESRKLSKRATGRAACDDLRVVPADRVPIAERNAPRVAIPLLGILLAPLAAPVLLVLVEALGGLVLKGEVPDAAWLALLALGPAVPLYVLLLPLSPFLVRFLRRGWAPRFSHVLGVAVSASLLIDAVFYLARRSAE